MNIKFCTFSVIVAATLLNLTVVSCGNKKADEKDAANKKKATSTHVTGYIVQTEPYSETIEVPGNIVSNETADIHPEVSGKIVSLHYPEGGIVSKGTVIARIFDADLQAQLKKLEVQLNIARQTESRQKQLLEIQGISQQDYDLSLLQVRNLQAEIEILKTDISRTVVTAPFTGKLGLRNISIGTYVTPATSIGSITQTTGLNLDFFVQEKYTSRLRKGQMVDFKLQNSTKSFSATITATDARVDEANRTLKIRGRVSGSDPALIPGAYASVNLRFENEPNTILIPSQAIISQARSKKVIVYKEGAAIFKDVTTAARDSSRIRITSGLTPGDTVVVTGLMILKPEQKIVVDKIVN